MIWVLVKFGRKVVCAAPSNKAADNMLLTVLANKPEWADQGMTGQFLRLTTSLVGKRIIPYEVAPDAMDISKPLPTPYKASQAEDESNVEDTVEHHVAQFADDEAKWFEWAARVSEWDRATEDVRAFSHGNVTESEVPTTRRWASVFTRSWRPTLRRPNRIMKLSTVERCRRQGPFKAKRELFKFRREMEARVLKQTDCIFSTINNLGSRNFEEEGFSAGYIFIDEGGQTSVASLAVALTEFTKFEALLLIGDPMQLPPTILAKYVNEVMHYSQISPMEFCVSHRLPLTTLTVQYRMAEEIALWPSQFYYEGVLRNQSKTKVYNAWRQAVRVVFLEDYGLQDNSGNGSEYFWIDVARSASRLEHGGKPL
ncbi:MAG: hypothetical protein Q9204_004127 [Flavoplaca sp. TL-2023a]